MYHIIVLIKSYPGNAQQVYNDPGNIRLSV